VIKSCDAELGEGLSMPVNKRREQENDSDERYVPMNKRRDQQDNSEEGEKEEEEGRGRRRRSKKEKRREKSRLKKSIKRLLGGLDELEKDAKVICFACLFYLFLTFCYLKRINLIM
jgi:hypothetical protein